MEKIFYFNRLTLLMLAALGSPAMASTTFTGDTNQSSTNDPAPVYTGDILVGNNQLGGTPQNPAGTLVVNGGTKLNGNRSILIGNGVNSSGKVTVTDSTSIITLARYSIIGNSNGSYGELIISNGAVFNAISSGTPAAIIGNASNSTGIVNVSGRGSLFNNTGSMRVGESGNGTLNISNNATTSAWAITLGQNAGSRGIVNIEGGTLLLQGNTSPGYEYVLIGAKGEGVMNVIQGGQVNDRYTLLGGAGGQGALNVSGNNSIFNSALFTTVGTDVGGAGEVIVSDGGTLNTSASGSATNGESLILGNVAGATGSVLVSGANATVNATGGSTVIGKGGDGSLTLQNDGVLNTDTVNVASAAGSTGVLNIGAAANTPAAVAGSLNDDATINFGDGDGTLNFNHTGDITFVNLIQGNGNVAVNGGETTLTAANSWSGITNINAGTLRAGVENTFSPDATYAVAADGTLDTNGFSQTIGSVTNAGTINLVPGAPGSTLTVNGNYTGNGGLLVFGTELADDSSATDRLVVTGDTAGTSRVAVTNLGGTGAQTLNGIELISVAGKSEGEFAQQGRIVAGAWEYHLARGEGTNNSNWYLSNQQQDNGGGDNPGIGGGDNPGNGGGDNPGNGGGDNPGNGGGDNPGNGGGDNPGNGGGDNPGNGGEEKPGNGGGHFVQELRPEGGAYASNLYAADMMFSAPLDGRMGETEYTDSMTGERHLTSLWLKNTGGHTRYSDSTGQLKTRANRYSLMLGGDLASGNASNGSTWRTGALAGYGNSQSRTQSNLSGYGAKGSVDGYTTGLYATWYGDGSSERGAYVDALVRYSWFRNTVEGDELAGEKYSSKGLSATLETGYVFAMGNIAGHQDLNWYLQPKATATWSGIKANDHQEVNGTHVSGDGNDNVNTRLGLKTFLKGHSKMDDGKSRNFKPFVEISWVHNTESRGATLDGVEVSQSGVRNIGELRTGVEGRLSLQWNVTGYVVQQIGDKGYSDTAAGVGLKYSF